MTTPQDSNENALERPFIDVIVESWRLSRTFARLLAKIEMGEAARYQSQLRFFQKRMDDILVELNLKIVNLEGQPYDPGMAATAINISDFAPEATLLIDQMIEPVIMGNSGIRRFGTVTVRLAQS